MEKHYKLVYVGLHPPVMRVEGPGILATESPVIDMNESKDWLALLDKVYEAGLTRGRNEVEEPSPMDTQAINSQHYKVGGIECIDYLKAKLSAEELRGFLKGNAIKYLSRAEQKGHAEDYAKANWYTTMLSGKDPRTT